MNLNKLRNKTLVFTATYNEAENLDEFLSKSLKFKDVDVLIIDDNSPDKTSEIVERHQLDHKNLFLIKRSGKLGLDTAHKEAYEFAYKKNYKNFISLDADLSHDPSQIPSFIKILETKPFVIGSRYIKGGKNEMKLSRLLLSYLGNRLIKFVFNIDCNEYTTSFRGFNLSLLNNFEIRNVRSKGYSFFMETIYQIHKSGHSIKETPIIFKDRKKGVSKIPKIESLRTLKNLLLLKIR